MKIIVVQIAMTGDSENGITTEYLDNQGRVWYDGGMMIDDIDNPSYKKWQTIWKLLSLPDEPNVKKETK